MHLMNVIRATYSPSSGNVNNPTPISDTLAVINNKSALDFISFP